MNDLALYQKMIEQNALAAVEKIGLMFAKSGMFGVNTEAQGQVMAMTCLAENITPVEFGKTYHVIEGKLSMRADAMQAKFQESGGRIQWLQSDAAVCEAKFFHPEYTPDGVSIKVTYQEFLDSGMIIGSKSGEVKDNWKKHPRQMLRARVISEGVRMVNPSIVAGVYTPEEVSDFDKPSPTPRRNGRNAPPPEPKEADATVIDEPAPNTQVEKQIATTIDLSDIEAEANAYLERIGWLSAGKTWRELAPEQITRIANGMASFRAKATAKETA